MCIRKDEVNLKKSGGRLKVGYTKVIHATSKSTNTLLVDYWGCQIMRKLVFSDTEAFYKELRAALKKGERIEVITDYKRYSELPDQLKNIFELQNTKSATWVSVATNAFIPHSRVGTSINYSALYILGTAGFGAIVGGICVGPVGAAVGGGIGALVGTVAVATIGGKHYVEIEIDASGKLRIKIDPIDR